MSKERAAKVMQEIFSKGTYEGDLLGIKVTDIGAALDPQFERVSDTPRTDVAEHNMGSVFSRHLERELVAARAEIVRLKGEAESWEKVFDRTCELLAEAKTKIVTLEKFFLWTMKGLSHPTRPTQSEWDEMSKIASGAVASMKEGGK